VTSQIRDEEVGFTLSPPAGGRGAMEASPASSDDAIEAAWEDGVESSTVPTRVHATYGVLDVPPNFREAPVWLVTFEGTCIILDGPVGAPPCREGNWMVFVNADNGKVMFSFADTSLNL
jgi:hypothetical protein